MKRIQLTTGQVEMLLGYGEDYYVDYKAQEIQPSKLSRWVAAFANSSGGDIYVGIDKVGDGKFAWRGFQKPEDANAHAAVLQESFPASDNFTYTLLEAPENPGFVMRVEVAKTPDIRTASDGKPYTRVNAAVKRVESEEAFEVLRLQKGITSFERATVDAEIDIITDSYQVTEFVLSEISHTEAEPWLRKQQLIREGKPTVAGVVLFSDEPQVVQPKASVIVYRYATSSAQGTRDRLVDERTHLVEGSAYQQIQNAVKLTTRLIEDIKNKDLESVTYPAQTLHEIITNAVIHRDYSQKDNVHVRVFDDRVEVESPGRLPGHVTPKNILNARFSRNENIERLLHKFPNAPNKNVGEGLNTAFIAMETMRLAKPEITEHESSVVVYIRHQPLDSPATLVLNYLAENDTINNSRAREITGIQRDQLMLKTLKQMETRKAIERVPNTIKGGSRYRLPSKMAD